MFHLPGRILLLLVTTLSLVIAPAVPAHCFCGARHGETNAAAVPGQDLPPCCRARLATSRPLADARSCHCRAPGTPDRGGPCRNPNCPCRNRPPLEASPASGLPPVVLSAPAVSFEAAWVCVGRASPIAPSGAVHARRAGEPPPTSLEALLTPVLLI